MSVTEMIFMAVEMLGTVAFALSGAMTGIKRHLDFFGVLLLGATAATGGGIIRDVLIGSTPPLAFEDYKYMLVAVLTSAALFLCAYFSRGRYHAQELRIEFWSNIFDALGLGAFAATGVQTGINAGLGDNGFLLVFLGMLTGIGGGILRDLFAQQLPMVLYKHIYAVACMLGALVYLILWRLGVGQLVTSFVVIALVFTVRMLATRYHWDLPHVE